jgi:hypothetical protein
MAADIVALDKLANNTDTGLQTLYEVVRAIDKDVKRLKKKAKGNLSEIDQKDIDLMKENYVKHYENRAQIDELKKKVEAIGGLSVMPCSQVQPSEAETKGGYTSENDHDYYYYHANNKVKPGSTYKQIEFDNGTDMFTIVLNDGRKIASDITHIKNLLLKEANKLQ